MVKETADLPLRHDAASRFVPYLIAVMVYLAALALAGAMVIGGAVGGWTSGLRGTLTVHILPNPAGDAATLASLLRRAELDPRFVSDVETHARGPLHLEGACCRATTIRASTSIRGIRDCLPRASSSTVSILPAMRFPVAPHARR